ncbi:MAG: ferrous iron transport protein B [Pirellulales bacterium]|nr:ferrous iron transport protein B [Pirellulales bacterium]
MTLPATPATTDSATSSAAVMTIALVGNPNTGKSTLFAALANVRQRTGNYPGVTVEKKVGRCDIAGVAVDLVDLPGTYSLAPRSPDEMVAVDVLLGRRKDVPPPDAILCIVDASNLERNLFVVSQVLALGRPVVVALNMIDVARQRGVRIDTAELARRLNVTVVPVQANRRIGLEELRQALVSATRQQAPPVARPLSPEFYAAVERLLPLCLGITGVAGHFLAERLLLDTSGYLEHELSRGGTALHDAVKAERETLHSLGQPVPACEAVGRYAWIGERLRGVLQRPALRPATAGDALDRVLTHRWWGTMFFAALMLLLFSTIFWVAPVFMDAIDQAVTSLGDTVGAALPAGPVRALLVDGVIAGVGGVVVFVPQIMLLFLFIGILEDCGYMARAAFLMDRLMSRVGLSGKSFIPLLSSFACAIPGIMATRVIENRRDRLTTILVAPLMSCSARLPVYLLLIGAVIPANVAYLGGWLSLQSLTLFAMYLVGILAAVVVAWLLKGTLLRGETPPFVLELPSYKWPSLAFVLRRMLERGWEFVKRAGSVIVAVAIVVWAAQYYPYGNDPVFLEEQRAAEQASIERELATTGLDAERIASLNDQLSLYRDPDQQAALLAAIAQRHSYLAQLGRVIEPVVRPLGWDWRIGAAAIASFPAREVVLGTLGVIYNVGEDVAEEAGQTQLQARLRQATWDHDSTRPVFTVPTALSIMVFFALCAQCVSTLAIIGKETQSWFWPIFTFVYMTLLAYVGALATYQVGMWLF